MIALNGRPCSRIELHIPWRGRWVATVMLPGDAPTGRVTITWGSASLVGSVEPGSVGAWQGEARAKVVGGLGWATVLPARWLQNDAGLAGAAVAQQIAALAKETLVAPPTAFRGSRASYSRARRTAAASLNDVLVAGAIWWTDLDGTTRAGARPAPAAPRVEILDLDPSDGRADIDAEDVGLIPLGGVIPASPPRRPTAYRIVELMATAGGAGQKFLAYLDAA